MGEKLDSAEIDENLRKFHSPLECEIVKSSVQKKFTPTMDFRYADKR